MGLDITEALEKHLKKSKREPDGLLHCSSDLVGSLRHAQLRAAGAPTISDELISSIRLMTGTQWHSYFVNIFSEAGIPFMAEVNVDQWLPEGWAGTPDWLLWNSESKKFELKDLKTTKGEAMQFRAKDGMSIEHHWQLSAYWYALKKSGLPLENYISVYYLPMNDVRGDLNLIHPLEVFDNPIDEDMVSAQMEIRWGQTEKYLVGLTAAKAMADFEGAYHSYVTSRLAPVQDRVQKTFWVKANKHWDLKLTPHWSAAFCPYPDELCDCNRQGTEKIGHFEVNGSYVPRKGYADIEPEVWPRR